MRFNLINSKFFLMAYKDEPKKQGQDTRKSDQTGSGQNVSDQGRKGDSGRRDLSEESQEENQQGSTNERTQPDQSGRNQPKVTNQDTSVTNQDEQEDVDENSGSASRGNQPSTRSEQPEIDTPIHDTEKTEKKIPDR